MRPSLLCAGVLAAVAVAAGCGSGQDGEVRAWNVAAPYLPPPDPSALGRETDSAPASETRSARRSPRAGAEQGERVAEGAPSDAEIAALLREAYGGEGGTDVDRATIDPSGKATIPATAPRRLVALMRGANEVARKPYVYGGGHGRNPHEIWADSAYDCSGSISYALAAAGYIEGPMASGPMMTWGKPGPGKWVSIYANEGHAFMVVAGLRFDTSGRQNTGTRWQAAPRSTAGFVVRHPPGL